MERGGIDNTVDRSNRAAVMSEEVARIAGMRVRATVRDREQDRGPEQVRGWELNQSREQARSSDQVRGRNQVRDPDQGREQSRDTGPAQARDLLEDLANEARKVDAMIVMTEMNGVRDRKLRIAAVRLEVSWGAGAGLIRIDRRSRVEQIPLGTETAPAQRGIAAVEAMAEEVSPFSAWAELKENGWKSGYRTT